MEAINAAANASHCRVVRALSSGQAPTTPLPRRSTLQLHCTYISGTPQPPCFNFCFTTPGHYPRKQLLSQVLLQEVLWNSMRTTIPPAITIGKCLLVLLFCLCFCVTSENVKRHKNKLLNASDSCFFPLDFLHPVSSSRLLNCAKCPRCSECIARCTQTGVAMRA